MSTRLFWGVRGKLSINEKMTAIANAIRSKTGTTGTLTLDGMTEKVNGIFSAFYTLTNGSGKATQTFYQIPFAPDIVSIQIKYGIGNLEDYIKDDQNKTAVFTVEIIPGFARGRKAIHGTRVPQEIISNITVTSVADGNGTYTVSVYAGGSTFYDKQPLICFLAKSRGD